MKGSVSQGTGYTGIDLGKYFFACTIPLFHIAGRPVALGYVSEYISRLAVPFFFIVSGFFLSNSITKKGRKRALVDFEKHNLFLYLFWLAIDLHILQQYYPDRMVLLHECICNPPAYLWFIPAMMFGGCIICLVPEKHKKYAYIAALALYIVGTFFSDSYVWISGGMPDWYKTIFMTTKNGLFFGFPMMMIGQFVRKVNRMPVVTILSIILLWLEVYFVSVNVQKGADRSMYFLLPIVAFVIVCILKNYNPRISTLLFRKASAAIYLMQYVTIYYGNKIAKAITDEVNYEYWIVYTVVLLFPTIIAWLLRGRKIGNIVF